MFNSENNTINNVNFNSIRSDFNNFNIESLDFKTKPLVLLKRFRKPTDSTAVAVCFESEAMSAASAVADVVVITAAGIAIDTDFQRAGQTCVGKDSSGCRPLRRIESSGANRKNATNSRSTLSKVRV